MMYFLTRKGRATREKAKELYSEVVRCARKPVFYAGYNVSDTLEGRFEMIALHGGLLVNRLCREDMGADGRYLAQAFFDVMFINLDWSIREAGVGDLAVPRRIKKMMADFKGRAFAYDEAVRSDFSDVVFAVMRNIYPVEPKPPAAVISAMACYIEQCAKNLEQKTAAEMWQGKFTFPEIEQDNPSHVIHAA